MFKSVIRGVYKDVFTYASLAQGNKYIVGLRYLQMIRQVIVVPLVILFFSFLQMAAYFAPLLLYLVNPIQRTIIVPSNVSHTKRSRETVSLTFSEQKTSITIPGLTLLLSAELRSRDITQAVHNRIISLTQSLDLACAFKYTEIIDTIIWERNEFHCPGPKQEASKAFRLSEKWHKCV